MRSHTVCIIFLRLTRLCKNTTITFHLSNFKRYCRFIMYDMLLAHFMYHLVINFSQHMRHSVQSCLTRRAGLTSLVSPRQRSPWGGRRHSPQQPDLPWQRLPRVEFFFHSIQLLSYNLNKSLIPCVDRVFLSLLTTLVSREMSILVTFRDIVSDNFMATSVMG